MPSTVGTSRPKPTRVAAAASRKVVSSVIVRRHDRTARAAEESQPNVAHVDLERVGSRSLELGQLLGDGHQRLYLRLGAERLDLDRALRLHDFLVRAGLRE